MKEKINSNFKILTTFEPMTWWLLLMFLLIISLLNIKIKRNCLFDFIISLIDHFECLLNKQSKSYFDQIRFNVFILKASSITSNRRYKMSYLLWIIGSFFLVTIFSNEILSKLINPSYASIDSIDQLNQYQPSITSIISKRSFVIRNNLVFKLIV